MYSVQLFSTVYQLLSKNSSKNIVIKLNNIYVRASIRLLTLVSYMLHISAKDYSQILQNLITIFSKKYGWVWTASIKLYIWSSTMSSFQPTQVLVIASIYPQTGPVEYFNSFILSFSLSSYFFLISIVFLSAFFSKLVSLSSASISLSDNHFS